CIFFYFLDSTLLILLFTCLLYIFLFFFQAEDGIRDSSVTGVQTCALPISSFARQCRRGLVLVSATLARERSSPFKPTRAYDQLRSEERRVGKECRSRGAR